jgi:hypothetical protein
MMKPSHQHAKDSERYLKAAEVRQVCAIASSDVEWAEPIVGDAPSPDAA